MLKLGLLLTIPSFTHAVKGIAPEHLPHYLSTLDTTHQTIECYGKTSEHGLHKTIQAKINDDYCDCENNMDEPGTSACSDGNTNTDTTQTQGRDEDNQLFYCLNKGAHPIRIYRSRINDGVCDCCDGTDESQTIGTSSCANTCQEDGQTYRDERKLRASQVRQGIVMKETYIELSKSKLKENENNKLNLLNEINALNDITTNLEQNKLIMETREKKIQQASTGTESSTEEVLRRSRVLEVLDRLFTDTESSGTAEGSDGSESSDVQVPLTVSSLGLDLLEFASDHNVLEQFRSFLQQHLPKHHQHIGVLPLPAIPNNDNDIKQQLNELLKDTKSSDDMAHIHKEAQELLKNIENETPDDASVSTPPPTTDATTTTTPSIPLDPNQELQSLITSLKQTDLPPHPEAEEARAALIDHQGKVASKERELSEMRTNINNAVSYGLEHEFLTLKDKCISKSFQGYNYDVCLFKNAKQDHTRLGDWDASVWGRNDFTGGNGEPLRAKFSNGQRCYNGPSRSIDIEFVCGINDEILDVSEPSICEYKAIFSTPAACRTSELEELERVDL